MKAIHLLLALALLAITPHLGATTPTGKSQQLSSPDQVPEGMAKSDWASIRAAYEAGRHAFQPVAGGWTLTLLAPEIAVEQPVGTDLIDGGTKSFGKVVLGSSASLTFTIRNTGAGILNGMTLTKNGANLAGLYTQAQVQALNVGVPLLTRNPATGMFKLTLGIEKSAKLMDFVPFPLTAPATTINAQGKLEFEFTSPDDAAFFRVHAE